MGRLYILIGKSASGKDALYKALLQDPQLMLKPYVGFTTRPIREGEVNGREYYFSTEEDLRTFEENHQLIEKRVYHTVHGDWCYFSVDNASVNLEENSYLYIGTLESYLPLRDYYGKDRVIPVYIEVEDGLRLYRALERERQQKEPKYAEMCRRFLSDTEDFSEDHLQAAGISRRFENIDFPVCLEEIRTYLQQE